MKTTRIDAHDLNSMEERLGVMEKSIISAIHAMTCEGAPLDSIMSMKECMGSFNATIWSACALISCSKLNDEKENEFIKHQKQQIEDVYQDIKEMLDYCQMIREKRHLEFN
jgi:Mg2+ and Co2+ transporter CorA